MPAFQSGMTYYWSSTYVTNAANETTTRLAMAYIFEEERINQAIYSKHNPFVAGYRPVTGNIDGSSNTNWWQ